MSKTVNTGVKLEEDIFFRLKKISALKDRSPHFLMKSAIFEYVQREERYEQEKAEDLQRWEHYQLTGKSVSNQAVENWLSSWDLGSAA